mmetsp:Transcript_3511/g.12373  ORF Transcript_3511/g.12373 Transcript_3511/m.12373 type:complete len:322 (-) Transcript_3511:1753-2718(-)
MVRLGDDDVASQVGDHEVATVAGSQQVAPHRQALHRPGEVRAQHRGLALALQVPCHDGAGRAAEVNHAVRRGVGRHCAVRGALPRDLVHQVAGVDVPEPDGLGAGACADDALAYNAHRGDCRGVPGDDLCAGEALDVPDLDCLVDRARDAEVAFGRQCDAGEDLLVRAERTHLCVAAEIEEAEVLRSAAKLVAGHRQVEDGPLRGAGEQLGRARLGDVFPHAAADEPAAVEAADLEELLVGEVGGQLAAGELLLALLAHVERAPDVVRAGQPVPGLTDARDGGQRGGVEVGEYQRPDGVRDAANGRLLEHDQAHALAQLRH